MLFLEPCDFSHVRFSDTVLYFLNIAMFENIYIIFVVFHTFDLLNQIKVKNLLNK